MTNVLALLETIAAEPSKNAKQDLLRGIQASDQNELFQEVLKASQTSTTAYNIKQFDIPQGLRTEHLEGFTGTLEQGIDWIQENLVTRKLTGNEAKDELQHLLHHMLEDDAEVLSRIIKKDLRSGFSSSTTNKIWKSLIPVHPYNQCSAFSTKVLENLQLPVRSQLKSDGLYCDTVVTVDSVTYWTRQGNELPINDPQRDAVLLAEANATGEFVIMGEALVTEEDGSVMAREASNGYMNRDDKDLSRIHIAAWHMLPLSEWNAKHLKIKATTIYDVCFARLTAFLAANPTIRIELTEDRLCHTVQDIVAHFKDVRDRGEEGLILKSPNAVWKDGKSKDMVKLKVVIEVEMEVIEWYYGHAGHQHEHNLGGFKARSKCGKIEVRCGGGYSLKQREGWIRDFEALNGVSRADRAVAEKAIFTMKCNGVTTSRSKPGMYSLYLPRFKEFRIDKSVADDLIKIQEQEAAFTDALKLLEK